MEQNEPQDPSALPPLFFEPEVDSDSQLTPEDNSPPTSALIPRPAERNEAKLSLSSYQSVTTGDITPTREEISPAVFQDSGINDVTPKPANQIDAQNVSDLNSPEIISTQSKVRKDSKTVIQKTSTPIRQERVNEQTSDLESSCKERSRTGNRVSFQKTDSLDPDDVRVPVTGYEVVEQRAKFTVFKLHVHKGDHDNWFVFRRYTDFVQLQNRLKILFPTFRFSLPPKRWFRDNYDKSFLEDRQLGLQSFIDSALCHRDVCNSKPVQEFFCFNDPPGPSDSLEEIRAYCDSLEDAVYSLKKEMKQKDGEIDLLKEELSLYKSQVEMLSKALRTKNENGARKSILSPANSMAECDHLAPEADQSQDKMTVQAEIHQSGKTIQNGAIQSQAKKQSHVTKTGGNHSRPLANVAF